MTKVTIILISLLFFFATPLCCESPSLKESELIETFSGNTFTGRFSNSKRRFAIYFSHDGQVYLQKEGDGTFLYYGKWSTQNNLLVTPWPYLDLSINQNHKMDFYKARDLTIYKLQIFPLGADTYEPYRPRLCGCDHSPPVAFPSCTFHSGKVPLTSAN